MSTATGLPRKGVAHLGFRSIATQPARPAIAPDWLRNQTTGVVGLSSFYATKGENIWERR